MPSYIKWFTNFETLTSLNTGSGNTTRFFGFAFLIFYNKLSFLFLVAVLYIFNEIRRFHLLNPISLSNKREPVFDTNSFLISLLAFSQRYRLFLTFCGRCSSCFRSLGAIFRATLRAATYTGSIQRTAYDVITYTREVFHTTATNEYDRVLLQVVAFTRDVRVHLFTVG